MFQAKLYNSVSGSITCLIEGQVYTIDRQHPNYSVLLKSFKENDTETFLNHHKIEKFVATTSTGVATGIKVDGDKITYKGVELHSVLVDYIFAMRDDGFDIDYLIKFLDNLMANPSKTSVDQSFEFLKHRNMPIDEDGCFLAYKTVVKAKNSSVDPLGKQIHAGDYVDKYSQVYRNNHGDEVSMPRNMVDDNSANTCSRGFHVGALAYSGPGGSYNSPSDSVIIVKVNPADVVSVPSDHSAQKLRVCKYTVVGDYEGPMNNSCVGEATKYDFSAYDEDYDLDDDEDEDDDNYCESCGGDCC